MSLQIRFLTLSMKEQIYITIIILTIFCILVVISICCSLSYEFLKDDYKKKQLYFYNKYKDYLDSCYYFHNIYLLQYEEIVKRMQKQTWKYVQVLYIYTNNTIFDDYSEALLIYDDSRDQKISSVKTDKNYSELFVLIYAQIPESYEGNNQFEVLYNYTLYEYQSLSNSIITHDIYDFFQIPGIDVSIYESPLFVNINYSSIFSFNATKIHQKILEIQNGDSSYIDYSKLYLYFQSKIYEHISSVYNIFDFYILEKLDIFRQMFNDAYNEVTSDFPEGIDITSKDGLMKFSTKAMGHFSFIDYGNNFFYILSFGINNDLYYCETNLINDYLFFMNKILSSYFDSTFIPLYFGNNTIISPKLCLVFKLKQSGFQINEEQFNDLYNGIKKGNNTLESCFFDKNLLNTEFGIEMNDLKNVNYSFFLKMDNLFYKGITYLLNEKKDEYPFYYMKYYYPNYNVLKDFQSEYLILNQVHYYFFSSFKLPMEYSQHILQTSENCFYLIILLIFYTWIICLIVNLIIYSKVIDGWTEPIKKLQEAVESSSITDETIFKYKDDDIINELFVTCKELLSGQIDNNEQGIKKFNILSIPKDKQKIIDKNIYKKNLIINNDIMNNLINQQQTTMDFSKNIELNEPNIVSNKKSKKNKIIKSGAFYKRSSENNINFRINDDILDKNNKNIKNKTLEEKENEPYVKLFKISEYIDFSRSKLEPHNYVILSNNSTIDESKMSKLISKNNKSISNSITNISNFKGSIIKTDYKENNENNENISVNMYDEDNISYLWYMEAKKKNNKSFNYNLNEKYSELFTDFNDSYKYNNEMKEHK